MANKFLDNAGLTYLWSKLKALFVPKIRTINGKSLENNITLTSSDVGAASSTHTHNYAGSSTVGGAANSAVKATQDGNGNNIANTYATKAELQAAVQQLQEIIAALNLGLASSEEDM